MPHKFRVTTEIKETGIKEELHGEFPDKDWDLLQRYLACSWRLASCNMAKTQHDLHFGFKGEIGKPVTFTATLPPEDDIAAFLMRMRPFVLKKKEPTNFFKIRNILARYLTLPSARAYLDRLHNLYQGSGIPVVIKFGELAITSEEALDKWLYGYEYHQDLDKQRELENLYRVFPEENARVIFLYQMLDRASAIGKLGALIDGFTKKDGNQSEIVL
jgi:hypothetical protein